MAVYRLRIDRLLMQIECVLEINDLRTVTKEVVETPRESLSLGKPEREKDKRLKIVGLLRRPRA